MELKNKIVLITGGNSGLGLSTAKALLKEGAIVHTISRDEQKQNEVRAELNDKNFYTHKGDITNYKDVESVVLEIGNIDILINNAGVWIEGTVNNNSPEEIIKALDVNTKGVIFTVKAVLPQMLKKDDGYIFNISSSSGLKARANESVYVASKMAVTGFTDSLKEDLKPTNVKVTGFYPGGMNTEFFKKGGFPKDNSGWMNTDKVAGVIVSILKLDDSMILDHVVLSRRNTKK